MSGADDHENSQDSQDGRVGAIKPKTERQQLIEQDKRGRFAGLAKLTEKQEKLAGHLADGVPVVEAGRLAGYSQPHTDATRARRTPQVAARVLELQRMRIGRTGALAIRVIEEILSGKIDAPASVRLDAGKYVLKVNGVELQADKRSDTKDLRQMSMAELMEIAAAFKAKTAPTVPGDDAQAVEIIEQSTT
jgi:hypothetical protein